MPSNAVLLVDDDTFVRAVLRDALANMPLRILEARDGDEALQMVQRERPDVVLLDLFMPLKSGLQVLADLREKFPETKVVVVSSMDANPLVQQALASGASGFIAKPFHPVEIRSAVTQALNVY